MLAVSIKNLQQNTWKLLLPALLQKWAHICIEMQNLWKILILDEPWINFRLKLTMLKKSLLLSFEFAINKQISSLARISLTIMPRRRPYERERADRDL